MNILFFKTYMRRGDHLFRVKQYAKHLEEIGCKVDYVLPFPETWSRYKKLLKLTPQKIIRELLALRRSEVIFFTPNVAMLFYIFMAKLLRKRVIIEHINSFVSLSEVIKWYPNLFDFLSYWLADKIIAYSESLKKDLITMHNLNSNKIEVIYPNVDLNKFKPIYNEDVGNLKRELNIRENQFVVFYHGMHHKWHGVEYLFKTAELLEDMDDIVFVFFPGGPDWEKRKGNNLRQIPEKGHFSDELPKYIQISDVWCSGFAKGLDRGDRTFNSTMIQAMAMARPIITSPGREKTKFLKDGINVFFVEPENPEAIKEKILFCLNNYNIAKAVGFAARELCEKQFSIEKLNQVLEQIVFRT